MVRHPGNRGKGVAIRSGLAAVRRRGFTHVLLMDGDLQHRPSDVPRLIDAAGPAGVAADADVIVGARSFDRAHMPASRYWSNVLGSWALGGLVGVPIRDTQSGFRLIPPCRLESVLLTSTGYEIETEMRSGWPGAAPSSAKSPSLSPMDGGPSKIRRSGHHPDLLPRPLLPLPLPPLSEPNSEPRVQAAGRTRGRNQGGTRRWLTKLRTEASKVTCSELQSDPYGVLIVHYD